MTLALQSLQTTHRLPGASMPRRPLTIPELFVPDAFQPACRSGFSGLCRQGPQKLNICRHLAALAGGGTPNEGLTRNLLSKGHRLCRPLPALLPNRKHIRLLILLKPARGRGAGWFLAPWPACLDGRKPDLIQGRSPQLRTWLLLKPAGPRMRKSFPQRTPRA